MASGNRLGDRLMPGSGPNPVIAVMSATRPPFLRKQTFAPDLAMSRKCQKETYAAQQTNGLFDHLVGAQ